MKVSFTIANIVWIGGSLVSVVFFLVVWFF